jgi:hypothetical protein
MESGQNVQLRTKTASSTSLLTPRVIQLMLNRRLDFQVVKFRTTCTDCVPNL